MAMENNIIEKYKDIPAIEPRKRGFIATDLEINTWQDIEPYAKQLLDFDINSSEALVKLIAMRSEFVCVVEEDSRWRYINQSRFNENEKFTKDYELFVTSIYPNFAKHANELDKKILDCGYLDKLDDNRFKIYIRNLKNNFELFREENLALETEIQLKCKDYSDLIGSLSITHNGNELTMAQASKLLQSTDRDARKEVFEKIQARRYAEKDKLNELFDSLHLLRQQVAQNAGFDNFRDYAMRRLNRFDYNVSDCEDFHEAILKEVVPIASKIYNDRKAALQAEQLQPYDLDVDTSGKKPLQPFDNVQELIDGTIVALDEVDTYFATCVATMQQMNRLDLDSRKAKSPGGYNMTLPETGVPFVFMNGAGTHSDVHTMVHEAGHAVHSMLMHDLPFDFDTEVPSETAELASMSMELLSMPFWKSFYNEEDHQRAIRQQLESILLILPWIAVVDKFQHWIYTHPNHSVEDREKTWLEIHKQYYPSVYWEDYIDYRKSNWQRQLHIFEIPFYYIEYGLAQLGAIAIWKSYNENPKEAIANYKKALSLGNTVTIPQMFSTAGISFDFSKEYISKLMQFVLSKL